MCTSSIQFNKPRLAYTMMSNSWYPISMDIYNRLAHSITAIYHSHKVHSRQMVVFTVYTTGGTFDLVAGHSTNVHSSYIRGMA